MKNHKNTAKLTLSRETLRTLNEDKVREIVGGAHTRARCTLACGPTQSCVSPCC